MPKPTPKQLKALERQIAHDQSQPIKPAEKRLKLNISFGDAVRQLSRKLPRNKQL